MRRDVSLNREVKALVVAPSKAQVLIRVNAAANRDAKLSFLISIARVKCSINEQMRYRPIDTPRR
jgi:hypothetical protein